MSEPQIVLISWAALASMFAPMVVELLPTWAATAENGRFSSGVNKYWADGEHLLPTEVDERERAAVRVLPQRELRLRRRLQGRVAVALRLVRVDLHRHEREVRARVRRAVEGQGGDVAVQVGGVDAPRLGAERAELGEGDVERPTLGGAVRAELGADVQQLGLAVRREGRVVD